MILPYSPFIICYNARLFIQRVAIMVKSELVELLAARQPHLQKHDIELAVNCILEQMAEALESNTRIEVRDFGSFTLRINPARANARNPKTGEAVAIPANPKVYFRPGKQLKDRVNAARGRCAIK